MPDGGSSCKRAASLPLLGRPPDNHFLESMHRIAVLSLAFALAGRAEAQHPISPAPVGGGLTGVHRAESWRATSTINAPSPRAEHTAGWTGKSMIVWGRGPGQYG